MSSAYSSSRSPFSMQPRKLPKIHQDCPFFTKLPPELRIEIYQHYIIPTAHNDSPHLMGHSEPRHDKDCERFPYYDPQASTSITFIRRGVPSALSRTCQTIEEETRKYLAEAQEKVLGMWPEIHFDNLCEPAMLELIALIGRLGSVYDRLPQDRALNSDSDRDLRITPTERLLRRAIENRSEENTWEYCRATVYWWTIQASKQMAFLESKSLGRMNIRLHATWRRDVTAADPVADLVWEYNVVWM